MKLETILTEAFLLYDIPLTGFWMNGNPTLYGCCKD